MATSQKKRIGIIGAGFAGVTSAKILRDFGFDTVVFEKESEVGGVWASSRRYPGLSTQNVRSTYAFTDYPYPKGTPEWPSGEQVQKYIAGYCSHFGINDRIHLNTSVEKASLNSDNSWTLKVSDSKGSRAENVDFLIVANGIFSDPFVPEYKGADEFTKAGGKILHTVDFHNLSDVKGKNVLIVGYGKSACDVAMATVGTSANTTVIARHLLWKVPKKLKEVLNYKMLFLTRMGEALFPYIELKGFEKFLHGKGKGVRNGMLGSVQKVISKQLMFDDLGLNPGTSLETITRSTVSLATDGFYKAVKAGKLKVEVGAEIVKLEAGKAHLSNGKVIPADYIICGTGFHQRVLFFDKEIERQLTDERGNFRLYRQILPLDTPNLAFNGYNSSFFSQMNAEFGAVWIGAYLKGQFQLPSRDSRLQQIDKRLAWMEARTEGKHARGTNIIPFSMHNIDELLGDMKTHVSAFTRFNEWNVPINPANYAKVVKKVIAKSTK